MDVLVNNAGYVLSGAIEEATLEEAKAQFETNFFGVVRMIKAVMPIMRRQGSGQIINISSGAGLTPLPFAGFYSASKFALEGYTEALRHEVKPFHVKSHWWNQVSSKPIYSRICKMLLIGSVTTIHGGNGLPKRDNNW